MEENPHNFSIVKGSKDLNELDNIKIESDFNHNKKINKKFINKDYDLSLIFKAWHSKQDNIFLRYDSKSSKENFRLNISTEDDYGASFTFEICAYEIPEEIEDFDNKDLKLVATINGLLINRVTCINDGIPENFVADCYSQDEYDAFDMLSKWKYFDPDYDFLDPDKSWMEVYDCYIGRMYIEKEYRNIGIATYFWSNIHDMLNVFYNTNIQCIVTIPKPDNETDIKDNEDEEMKKEMIKIIKKAGFKQIKRNENYWAKNCLLIK